MNIVVVFAVVSIWT